MRINIISILTLMLTVIFIEIPRAISAENDWYISVSRNNLSGVNIPTPHDPAVIVSSVTNISSGKIIVYNFDAENFPGFYDARGQNKEPYNIPEILRDVPDLWKDQGALFKKVGAEMNMDPYALAAYCVFESYNEITHKFNTHHIDGVATGIASTQVTDVRGGKVPGLSVRLPRDISQAKTMLLKNPEYGLRFLAAEFKAWYYGGDFFKNYYGEEMYNRIFGEKNFQGYHDLAKTFPRVAVPGWTNPNKSMGNYGTQAQYVSRAYVLYNAFRSADKN